MKENFDIPKKMAKSNKFEGRVARIRVHKWEIQNVKVFDQRNIKPFLIVQLTYQDQLFLSPE